MKVLYSTHQTTIPQLEDFVATIASQLYAEATALGVLVSGPQYWIYRGMDGKHDTVFTLEISLPVQGEITVSKFGVKEIPAFKAVSYLHKGSWDNMPQSYGAILQYIGQQNITMTDECREIYFNVDFSNPQNNRVIIQLGII